MYLTYISCSEAASKHIDNYIGPYICDMLLSSSCMNLCSQVLLQHNVSDRNSLYLSLPVPPNSLYASVYPFKCEDCISYTHRMS
jgi:hypothetical protein